MNGDIGRHSSADHGSIPIGAACHQEECVRRIHNTAGGRASRQLNGYRPGIDDLKPAGHTAGVDQGTAAEVDGGVLGSQALACDIQQDRCRINHERALATQRQTIHDIGAARQVDGRAAADCNIPVGAGGERDLRQSECAAVGRGAGSGSDRASRVAVYQV